MRLIGLVSSFLIACGGRTVGTDLPIEFGSGGSSSAAGGHFAGGALSTGSGGAVAFGGTTGAGGISTNAKGGNTGFGGAVMGSGGAVIGSGGAVMGSGGGSGAVMGFGGGPVTNVGKYCSAYCSQYVSTCPKATLHPESTCSVNCMASAMMRPDCSEILRSTLGCAIQLPNTTMTCSSMQAALFKRCEKELATLATCGLSLPGAEECETSAGGAADYCYHESHCGSMTFTTKCTRPTASTTQCSCFVDGQESFSISATEPLCSLDERMGCGPVLFQ